MNTRTDIPLVLSFIIVVIIFLLFCGGAITSTMMGVEMGKSGVMGGISWMWIPTAVSLLVSVLLGWVIFQKKSSE
jgi:hypothetical protein